MSLRRVSQIKITTIHFSILFIAAYCKDFEKLYRNPHQYTQPAFTCSKLTIETLQQGVKYVQS